MKENKENKEEEEEEEEEEEKSLKHDIKFLIDQLSKNTMFYQKNSYYYQNKYQEERKKRLSLLGKIGKEMVGKLY